MADLGRGWSRRRAVGEERSTERLFRGMLPSSRGVILNGPSTYHAEHKGTTANRQGRKSFVVELLTGSRGTLGDAGRPAARPFKAATRVRIPLGIPKAQGSAT